MSEPTVATVETLTAEVRTLVVGSRQVTLSVAKQLDTVPLAELEVMGRVRINVPLDAAGQSHVIGSHKPTGALALAVTERISDVPWVSPGDTAAKLMFCGDWRGGHARLALDGMSFDVWVPDWDSCPDYGCRVHRDDSKPAWLVTDGRSDLTAWVQAERDRLRQAIEVHRAALAAPLIVLAGLK